jgi:Zonular occludens toxin (Zot)
MIEVIEGKGVGAGKSYFVLERLVLHWLRGGTAYVSESFMVKWEACKQYVRRRYGLLLEDDQYHSVKSENIGLLHEHTPPGSPDCPVLIVIDEAQDQLNARDWNDSSKRSLFSWCCQSRHDDNDLIFVSQSAANVDKQVRRLATFTWSVRNARNFSIPGLGNVATLIRLTTFGLNDGFYFVRSMLDYDGRTMLERKWVKADTRLFDCYESKSMRLAKRRSGEAIAKKKLKREKGRHPMIKFFILGALIFGAYCGFKLLSGGNPFGSHKKHEPELIGKGHGPPAGVPGQLVDAHTAVYEVRVEPWVGQGKGWMIFRESGEFHLGRMSRYGMVEGIFEDVVRIRKPDNSLLYLVGEDWIVPVASHPSPTPAATGTPIGARWEGPFSNTIPLAGSTPH